jgi:CBS domain-containing protein
MPGRLTLALVPALTLLRGAAPVVADPPTFSTQRVISTQADLCFDVRTQDVDGDGDRDILSASYDGLIAWWENDGANPPGAWTKHVVTVFADGAHTVFAIHMDADADLDFLTATFNGAEVVWFEHGSLPNPWQEHEISFDAPFASDAWSADLDGDDDPDVIVNYDGFIDWYEHDGAPTPQAWFKHVVSPSPSGGLSVQAADIDRDGDLDLVSGPWFENNGAPDPTFTLRLVSTFPTGQAANSIFVTDVDRDGDLDILSAEDNRIAWHENDGNAPPTWKSRAISTATDMALAVYGADLDGDTDLDVLSASFMDDTIAWYESNGGSPPSFTTHTITTGAWGARTVHAADVEGDGDVDVLSGTQRDHDIVWYVNELNFADTDGDGMRNELDCAPGDATAFAVAQEIRNVRFDAAKRLNWSAEAPRSGSGTVHDVLRGRIGELPVGFGPNETCLIQATTATSLPPDPPPALGEAFYYVVRGKNACGVGSYGFASSGDERTSFVCP